MKMKNEIVDITPNNPRISKIVLPNEDKMYLKFGDKVEFSRSSENVDLARSYKDDRWRFLSVLIRVVGASLNMWFITEMIVKVFT